VRLLLDRCWRSWSTRHWPCRAGDACAHAAGAGHEPIVRLLIERGLDVELGQFHKLTALERAARHGQLGIVRLLLY
jgi:ankyrin repeat protein